MAMVQRVMRYVRMHGLGYTFRRTFEMISERILHGYDRRFRRDMPDLAALSFQREHQPSTILISVAVPVYNTKPVFFRQLIASLQAQTYASWEAVLYDGCSTDDATLAVLREIDDSRIRVVHGSENAGISGNTNAAVRLCRGEYVALCDHDDVLSPEALWRVAEAIESHQPDMIYSDEDKLTEDGRFHTDPHHKPDFCPDNLRSGNYICHLMVIRRELLERLGGLRPAFDGSQDHDLALRVSEVTQRIVHIPRMLYHWRTVGSSMSHQHLERCQDAAARAVTEHMARIGFPGSCTVEGSVLRLRYDVPASLTVATIRVPAGEEYACMNRAAQATAADVLLFVHESVREIPENFVHEMLMYAQRDDVGPVTPMLTDRRGRVLHAGYEMHEGVVWSRNRGLPAKAGGWHGMNRTSHNVMAVSAACVMIRRDHFIPFDESWRDGLGAADWSLRLGQAGLLAVYTPHARAVCMSDALLSGFRETDRFRERWGNVRDHCAAPNR